nr:MAG TPA: hypothetical protein [Caudoviricetes sp.]
MIRNRNCNPIVQKSVFLKNREGGCRILLSKTVFCQK